MVWTLHEGDCREVLPTLPEASAQCCVTSPPYWGLRDYGHAAQIGLEPTPEAYVAALVAVFREVWRVLKDDGTLWLNLGDSYVANGRYDAAYEAKNPDRGAASAHRLLDKVGVSPRKGYRGGDLGPKDLVGIPWRVAFALQADGWILRSEIIWAKPNPMPESVRDRPTRAHEHLFLLAKQARYYYDADAIAEPAVMKPQRRLTSGGFRAGVPGQQDDAGARPLRDEPAPDWETRNKRSVWSIFPEPFAGAHFAVMPRSLVEPCVKAGCPEGGVVLDPFAGAGTVAAVAAGLGRRAVAVELSPDYCAIIRRRMADAAGPLFARNGSR